MKTVILFFIAFNIFAVENKDSEIKEILRKNNEIQSIFYDLLSPKSEAYFFGKLEELKKKTGGDNKKIVVQLLLYSIDNNNKGVKRAMLPAAIFKFSKITREESLDALLPILDSPQFFYSQNKVFRHEIFSILGYVNIQNHKTDFSLFAEALENGKISDPSVLTDYMFDHSPAKALYVFLDFYKIREAKEIKALAEKYEKTHDRQCLSELLKKYDNWPTQLFVLKTAEDDCILLIKR